MTPAARIQAVIELLADIMETPRPADGVASTYFRNRRFIGSKDRAAITSRYYRILRHAHRLSWWADRADVAVTPRAFVIADAVLGKEHSPESLDRVFSGERYAPAPMMEEEVALAESVVGERAEHDDMPLSVRVECPDWAFEALRQALGDRFEGEMRAMMAEAPLDIRINTLKTTRDEALAALHEDGMGGELGIVSPLCIRLANRPPLTRHKLFTSGAVEIQDQGSQMVALVAKAQPGERVVDFCAGAGGKTLALGASMDNKGKIVAMDVMERRLTRAKVRFRRAGLHNIETRALSSEHDKYVKKHAGTFDLVLVDAPCSGTGTWRRDPDKRWQQLGPGLETLVPLQKSILDSASRLVKPGGRLVYATCSLLPDENENQVKEFLAGHDDFTLYPAREIIDVAGAGDYLSLSPAQHDTDGFFAAVMTRKGKPA